MADSPAAREVDVHRPGSDPGQYASAMLPAESLTEALVHLRRPFAPNAVKWKIQASGPKYSAKWAIIIGYIDARLVMERLNLVCGGDWHENIVSVTGEGSGLVYELTVMEQTHVDVGVGQGMTDDIRLKAMHSDGLKRVAVRFGVGVPLYAMPQLFLDVAQEEHEEGGHPTIKRLNNGKPGRLTDKHKAWLRGKYEEWLKTEGEAAFGPYLDHGDAPDSVGELAERTPESERNQPSERVAVESHSEERTEPVVTAAMRKKLWAEIDKAGLRDEEVKIRAILIWIAGTPHTDRIPRAKLDEVLAAIKDHGGTLQQIHEIAEDPEVDGHEIAKGLEQMILEGGEKDA